MHQNGGTLCFSATLPRQASGNTTPANHHLPLISDFA
jgi:hypothetical protein